LDRRLLGTRAVLDMVVVRRKTLSPYWDMHTQSSMM
jgi:hypothetical protein